MAQQRAVYDQNCRLMVRHGIVVPETCLTTNRASRARVRFTTLLIGIHSPTYLIAELSVLNQCRRGKGAEYRHGNRRGCLKGTRESVLSEIESWTKDPNKSPVFWLNGLAGTGKSTIAQTVSERVFADGLLGASFFCSRDFEDRSDLQFIFPSLAFQLAHKYRKFRSVLVPLLQSDPDVVYESLYSQMEKLIVEPLRSADVSTVIVIDALDECTDDEPQSAILSVMGRLVEEVPKVKFFITGRPEPRITSGFRLELLRPLTDVFVLHDVHPGLVNNDIRLFLKYKLSELAQRRHLDGWPTDEHVNLLCQRAAGLFVYAVATVKFLDSKTHPPKQRLDIIVNLPECTVPEGKTRFNPKTTLDYLYSSILQMAFGNEDPEVYSKVRSTIGAVILLANPLPQSAITELIGLDPEQVILFLTLVQSLLAIDEDPNQPVKPFHKSFPDFITDPSRCLDARFHISPRDSHLELARNCLRLMNNGLGQNLLSLPDYSLNSEVKDLQTRVKDRISIALEYACRSWHSHLTKTTGDVTSIISDLRLFLEEKFLAWLEVVSVLGAVRGAVVGLEKLVPWLQEVCFGLPHKITYHSHTTKQVDGCGELLDTTRDFFSFVTKFFEVASISATHIYHSALEIIPLSSIVRRLYHHRWITTAPRLVFGIPSSWKQRIAIPNKDSLYRSCAWSPCGQFIAAQTHEAVEVRDPLTSQLFSCLQSTKHTHQLMGPLAYSLDGRSICCASTTSIIIWDIQTGGIVREVRYDDTLGSLSSLVWSLDGRTIGGVFRWGCAWAVVTYDVALGRILSHDTLGSEDKPYLWAHGKSFQVMRISLDHKFNTCSIDIFEIGSTLTQVRSFPISVEQSLGSRWDFHIKAFSPISHHISISVTVGGGQLLVLDAQDPVVHLLNENGSSDVHCFSSNGKLFAASLGGDVHVWKYIHNPNPGYTPWRKFPDRGWSTHKIPLQFSPTSLSILGHFGDILQVWYFDNHSSPHIAKSEPYILIPPHATYIVTAHLRESTVTITNHISQTPPQFIDTGTTILGFALTGNVLLVAGSNTIVAWRITERGVVDGVFGGRTAGPGDSIWTISPLWNFTSPIITQAGSITLDETLIHIYHSGTDEGSKPIPEPLQLRGHWYNLEVTSRGRYYLHCHELNQFNDTPEDNQPASQTGFREGWVKDPGGKHRLWLPVEWRMAEGCAKLFYYFATLQLELPGDLNAAMF